MKRRRERHIGAAQARHLKRSANRNRKLRVQTALERIANSPGVKMKIWARQRMEEAETANTED